jgi:ribosomal protein S28E/S33
MTAPDLRIKGIGMQGAVTQVSVHLVEKGPVSASLGILS